jgi:hypothetical protein
MKHCLVGLVLLAALSGPSASACTPDELEAKMNAVAAKVQDLAQKDPQKISEWNQKFAAQPGAAAPSSLDDLCKLYDQMLADLN